MLMVQENPRAIRTEGTYIRTYSGRKFWPLDPKADEIFIEDVAHHLSLECRFAGATYCHYSVADHSLRVSKAAERMAMAAPGSHPSFAYRVRFAREIALWGLLHDASETYLKDFPKPIKHAPGIGAMYRAIEQMIMGEVIARFDLMPHEPAIVKKADQILCSTEKRDLVADSTGWQDEETLPDTIFPLDPCESEAEFLRRYKALTMARDAERRVNS